MLINFFKQVFFILISPDSFKITNHIKRYLLTRVESNYSTFSHSRMFIYRVLNCSKLVFRYNYNIYTTSNSIIAHLVSNAPSPVKNFLETEKNKCLYNADDLPNGTSNSRYGIWCTTPYHLITFDFISFSSIRTAWIPGKGNKHMLVLWELRKASGDIIIPPVSVLPPGINHWTTLCSYVIIKPVPSLFINGPWINYFKCFNSYFLNIFFTSLPKNDGCRTV
jgi:hypothetical protein